ncbi:hypothetical protein SDC9_134308 [bioreactor metagenome]|uniref:NodB homology domain-containing protein n=1 Tax=bioreactor metagenome TaxID=1076179 RepID=A0A645DCU6_9ZZZZ
MNTESKFLLIRDDDVNFFTSPVMLEEVYGFLRTERLPVNFSVIPAVNAAAQTYSADFGAGSYEPFLPPGAAGDDRCFPVSGNRELTEYLRELPEADFLMHGFSHRGEAGRYEFESPDRRELERKLAEGKAIFREAFGREPDTFVAPQDQYSPVALELLKREFRTFSLGWIDRRKLPYRCWPAYLRMKLEKRNYLHCGKLLLLEHPGCVFSRFRAPEQMMPRLEASVRAHRLTVIVTHHWEFYDEGGGLNRERWTRFRDTVLALAGTHRFLRFRELSPSHWE